MKQFRTKGMEELEERGGGGGIERPSKSAHTMDSQTAKQTNPYAHTLARKWPIKLLLLWCQKSPLGVRREFFPFLYIHLYNLRHNKMNSKPLFLQSQGWSRAEAKMCHFSIRDFARGEGLNFPSILSKIVILDRRISNGKPSPAALPPPPKSRMKPREIQNEPFSHPWFGGGGGGEGLNLSKILGFTCNKMTYACHK